MGRNEFVAWIGRSGSEVHVGTHLVNRLIVACDIVPNFGKNLSFTSAGIVRYPAMVLGIFCAMVVHPTLGIQRGWIYQSLLMDCPPFFSHMLHVWNIC